MDRKASETSSAERPQAQWTSFVSSLSMVPMTKVEAAALIHQMLGCYPSLNLHDPKIYIANMVTLLSGYPLWAGEDAVTAVKRKTKFIPTEAELHAELKDRTAAFRYAAEWESDAQSMIAAHKALPAPVEHKLSYEELREKYDGPNGEKWGFGELPSTTPQRAREALIAQIGQAAFDAIPDQKSPMKPLPIPF